MEFFWQILFSIFVVVVYPDKISIALVATHWITVDHQFLLADCIKNIQQAGNTGNLTNVEGDARNRKLDVFISEESNFTYENRDTSLKIFKKNSFLIRNKYDFIIHISHHNTTASNTVNSLCGTALQVENILATISNSQKYIGIVIPHSLQSDSYWIKIPDKGRDDFLKFQSTNDFAKELKNLVTTLVTEYGARIYTALPALKTIAIYFPQYHPIPENDRFWGVNFTEWTSLSNCSYDGVMKPLSVLKGGLGQYLLEEKNIRAQQARMAKDSGIYGFMYYHYWFSGDQAPPHHKVMYKIPELMLLDGEPNIQFMFSWANEPWSRTWDGLDHEVLLSQEYGHKEEWIEHFNYLLQFFKHPNYILVNNKPSFVLYRINNIPIEFLRPMLQLWIEMAIQNGFSGMHFISTINNFYCKDMIENKVPPEIEAAFHFWPTINSCFPNQENTIWASQNDVAVHTKVQYWGSNTNFDNRPRRPFGGRGDVLQSPETFGKNLRLSFEKLKEKSFEHGQNNFYFVNAWNEWNEQATLEPNDVNGFGYLNELKSAIRNFSTLKI